MPRRLSCSTKEVHAVRVFPPPICVAGPRAPLRSNLDDPEEWELSCSVGESVWWDEAHCTEPVACRSIIKCGTTSCTGSCPTSVVGHGCTAGKEPGTCETVGDLASPSQTSYRNQAWSIGVTHCASKPTVPSTCPLRNVTSTPESSGESHGTFTVTRIAQRMSSAHSVPTVPSGVGFSVVLKRPREGK